MVITKAKATKKQSKISIPLPPPPPPPIIKELWHFSNPAAGLTSWPGCMSPAIRQYGWPIMLVEAQRAKERAPNMTGIILDNPFGKYQRRLNNDGHIQTLLDQWMRIQDVPGLELVRNYYQFSEYVAGVRAMGIKLEVYIGYPESDLDPYRLGQALWPFIVNKIPMWFDGSAIRPEDEWYFELLRNWGIPMTGVEAFPGVGQPMDLRGYPAIGTEMAWAYSGGLQGSLRRQGKSAVIWRGPDYMPFEQALEILNAGIKLTTGLIGHTDEQRRQVSLLNEAIRPSTT